MLEIELYKSNIKNKRIKAVLIKDGKKIKTIHFGSSKKQTYIDHGDVKRKSRYIKRHINDRLKEISPGSLSMYLLWNKPTLDQSIKDYEKMFNVNIISYLT